MTSKKQDQKQPLPPDFADVNPAEIRPHPHNPRKDLGDLSELTDSIREQGVLEPLVLEPNPDYDGAEDGDGHAYQLLSGHRRLAAAISAGVLSVPAVIYPEASALGVQLERMLTENLQRSDLTAVEEADAYQEMLDIPDGGYTTASIATKVGRSKKHVSSLVKVAKLPESARDRILAGQLTIEDAADMASFAADKAAMERVERAADYGVPSFRAAVAREEIAKQAQRKITAKKRELTKAGVTVVDQVPDDTCYLDEIYESSIDSGLDEDEATTQFDEQVIKPHASCPGHAAHVISIGRGDVDVQWICTDPEQYHPRPEGDESDAVAAAMVKQDGEERRRRQEREETHLQLVAAGKARRQYLGEVLQQRESIDLARALLIQHFENEFTVGRLGKYGEPMRQYLADVVLPNLPDRDRTDDELKGLLLNAINRLTVPQLVLLSNIWDGLLYDDDLERPDGWAWTSPQTHGGAPEWRGQLHDVYGYEWSKVETDQMTPEPDDDSQESA